MHNRADAVSVYFSEITGANGNVSTPNKNLKIQRNIHSVIGHQVAIAEGLNLKTEAYFQYIYDAATGTDTNNYYSLMNEVDLYNVKALENKGKGRNYGIDINLDRNFGNGFYMMISQSLFRSEYKNPGFSWRASRYDSRFVSNLVAGKEWKLKNKGTKQRTLVANIKALYMGGVVYTPLDRAASAASDNSVYDYKAYNSKRAPNIVRIDFSIGIRKNRERSTHTLKLDIINVLNELAVVGEFYDVYNNKVAKPTGIPFLPNLLYRIEF
jgi:outer membrane receptor protein involved in Fe transport